MTNTKASLIVDCRCGASTAAVVSPLYRAAEVEAEITGRGWRIGPVVGRNIGPRWWWRGAGVCPGCASEVAA